MQVILLQETHLSVQEHEKLKRDCGKNQGTYCFKDGKGKKRNAAKEAWESIIKELDLGQHVSHKQASKKWENLKKKYKELKRPRTGTGTGQGEETPATWPFFMAMDCKAFN
ncbi:hypothetical protein JOQ06_024452 [Pogonophryne albipinna]|uniref:Myb/SANT-like DNA-binding domain-containing protein n=1 Tax=Pogonophryne albipinna TaxID=1090488 RepID=A0AAD6F501_9TELE|nr:hypothetical protein JOQ06_024452 [Pogonophryne albipinna]